MGKASRKKEKPSRIKSERHYTSEGKVSSLFFSHRFDFLAVFFLIITALLIYSNTLSYPFHFDDEPNIVTNNKLRDLSNFWPPTGTRYVGFLSFALNYHFGELNVFGYHLVNLLIHILNGLLIWWFVLLTFKTPMMQRSNQAAQFMRLFALFSALIFIAHPIQTQAVTYIVQRFTSLSTLFYLLSLCMYVKARLINQDAALKSQNPDQEKRKVNMKFTLCYLTSILSTFLAMKTKEISFTLPMIIVLYEFIFFSISQPESQTSNAKRFYFVFPFLISLTIIPVSLIGTDQPLSETIGELREAAQETEEISRNVYLMTQFSVIVTYIRLLFLPIAQNLDYDFPLSHSLHDPVTFFSFLFLLLILISALYFLKRAQKSNNIYGLLASFGVLWFFITLSVESSIIPIRDVAFEHRLYLPSIGAILVFGSAVFYILVYKKQKPPSFAVVWGLILITTVSLGIGAYHRNFVWKDEVALWEDVVRKSPNKARGHNSLGLAYYKQGRVEEAIREYREALKLDPDHLEAHHNLGATYAKQGRLEEAIQEYLIALSLQPGFAGTHNNLGLAYYHQGRLDEAIKEYTAALSLKPDFAEARHNLGLVYYTQGRLEEASREYREALRLKPDYLEAHHNLAGAYYNQGRLEEAIQELMIAIRLNPNHADARYNLGTIYKAKGLKDEAKREFETVLRLRPNDPKARQALEALVSTP